ncbi:hypothetical protein MMYC01_208107, partial [Madurella mycetomatis]
MSQSASDLIDLTPSQRKRLYEAIVMLVCLTKAYVEGKSAEATESEINVPRSKKLVFHCFVNKLAQICDDRRGGDTVTAFAVLQPGNVQYYFGCNGRNAAALESVRSYVADVLNLIGTANPDDVKKATRDSSTPLFSHVLQKIVGFNRPRIERYISVLAKSVEDSVHQTSQEDYEEVVDKTQELLHAIHRCYKGAFTDFIHDRCSDGPVGREQTLWDEIYHSLGRLLSYFLAVKVLITACKYWPQLFVDFTIIPVPSSRPNRDPPQIRKSASKLITAMTTDNFIINAYRHSATELQEWGLDKRIQEVTHHSNFKPIIHAEILVDDFIRRSQREDTTGEGPIRFFHQAEFGRYIGASKPTCRLCALYFNSQVDGVEVRKSHNNPYCNWRVPDVFVHDGERVKKERDAVLEMMIPRLRNDVFKAILDRRVQWNRFDSNNTATNPGMSDLTSLMSGMAVAD